MCLLLPNRCGWYARIAPPLVLWMVIGEWFLRLYIQHCVVLELVTSIVQGIRLSVGSFVNPPNMSNKGY